jgi:hypothetical protein
MEEKNATCRDPEMDYRRGPHPRCRYQSSAAVAGVSKRDYPFCSRCTACDSSYHFFLVPGVYHCGGGYVPYQEDMLGTLVRWVEAHEAPDSVVATAVLEDGKIRTRPVFAYPVRATYRGSGDIKAANNFVGHMPAVATDDLYEWAGKQQTALRRPRAASRKKRGE